MRTKQPCYNKSEHEPCLNDKLYTVVYSSSINKILTEGSKL